MSEKNPPGDPRALRITQQANGRGGRTFDLIENEQRLVLSFVRDDDDARERWQAEARVSRAADAVVVTGSGGTRREALTNLATQWRERALRDALPSFDWERMPEVLGAVRGLE